MVVSLAACFSTSRRCSAVASGRYWPWSVPPIDADVSTTMPARAWRDGSGFAPPRGLASRGSPLAGVDPAVRCRGVRRRAQERRLLDAERMAKGGAQLVAVLDRPERDLLGAQGGVEDEPAGAAVVDARLGEHAEELEQPLRRQALGE